MLVQLRNRTVERVHLQMDVCQAFVTLPHQRVQQKKTTVPRVRLPMDVFRAIVKPVHAKPRQHLGVLVQKTMDASRDIAQCPTQHVKLNVL